MVGTGRMHLRPPFFTPNLFDMPKQSIAAGSFFSVSRSPGVSTKVMFFRIGASTADPSKLVRKLLPNFTTTGAGGCGQRVNTLEGHHRSQGNPAFFCDLP